MDFTRIGFLGFLAAVAVLWRLAPQRWRPALLVVASLVFYCSSNPRKSPILAAGIAATFIAAKLIAGQSHPLRKRAMMAVFVAAMVAALTLFKANPRLHVLPAGVLMPLGFSYYTFKLISYVVDVYWVSIPAEPSLLSVSAYVAFFPQIVAGPIQRAGSFLPQVHCPKAPSGAQILFGIQRILLGYFKKFIVADTLGLLVNPIYDAVHTPGTPLLAAFYLYPLQLYADFSGLTDIAIGAAWLVGIQSPENFNQPFLAANPSEFWRRWHMSLTSWLTDYVFTPLRMAVREYGDAGLVFSLFVNMLLIGLWHGFRLTFVVFGLIHGMYLSVDALTARFRRRYYKAHPAAGRFTDWFGPVVTFHLVAIGMVFFRSSAVRDATLFLAAMWRQPAHWSVAFTALFARYGRVLALALAAYPLVEVADYFRRQNRQAVIWDRLPRWGRWSLYACTVLTLLFAILLIQTSEGERNPFVYAVF